MYEDPHVADSSSNVLCSKGTQTEKIYNMDGCSWNEGESTTSGGDSAYFDQEAFDLMANGNISSLIGVYRPATLQERQI